MEFTKALVGDQEVQPSNISKPGVFKGDDTPGMKVKRLLRTSSMPTISDTPESSFYNDLLAMEDVWSANAGSFTEPQRLVMESPTSIFLRDLYDRKTEKPWKAQVLTTPLSMRASIGNTLKYYSLFPIH